MDRARARARARALLLSRSGKGFQKHRAMGFDVANERRRAFAGRDLSLSRVSHAVSRARRIRRVFFRNTRVVVVESRISSHDSRTADVFVLARTS